MKALVIGSGGREHAICWKLAQSPSLTELYCAPGNPGTAGIAENIAVAVDDLDGLLAFAKDKAIDLTIVGPEYPLTLGVVDLFKNTGFKIFGPGREAAKIEGSKAFAKELMARAGIETAKYTTCSSRDSALQELAKWGAPVVLKDDGLAAGKGVFVCMTEKEAAEAVDALYARQADKCIVIEEYLEGPEASYIVATNGTQIVPMAASHDYKRIGDNDTGPNTGGMGTVSPTPHLSQEEEQEVLNKVMKPAIQAMEEAGTPYQGFLYAGIIKDPKKGLKVLEFNARLGDPETQVIMRRLNSDLFETLYKLSDDNNSGKLIQELEWDKRSAVCVVMAAKGYPTSVLKGDEISGIGSVSGKDDCVVFHAGTGLNDVAKLVTAGGRVLNVTAVGESQELARSKVYTALEQIAFNGAQYRKDIAS